MMMSTHVAPINSFVIFNDSTSVDRVADLAVMEFMKLTQAINTMNTAIIERIFNESDTATRSNKEVRMEMYYNRLKKVVHGHRPIGIPTDRRQRIFNLRSRACADEVPKDVTFT
jgi:hypothetical protein